ncbi:MAG: hypothetical protein H2169_14850, partial [Opitutus sp.]|nr:hypothetical protein [Opitutus sp.]
MSAALNRREFLSRLLPASLRERGADTPQSTTSFAPPPLSLIHISEPT